MIYIYIYIHKINGQRAAETSPFPLCCIGRLAMRDRGCTMLEGHFEHA